jgi:hypothetical protein
MKTKGSNYIAVIRIYDENGDIVGTRYDNWFFSGVYSKKAKDNDLRRIHSFIESDYYDEWFCTYALKNGYTLHIFKCKEVAKKGVV